MKDTFAVSHTVLFYLFLSRHPIKTGAEVIFFMYNSADVCQFKSCRMGVARKMPMRTPAFVKQKP